MPVSLSGIIHHSHSSTRLKIYHHIYLIIIIIPREASAEGPSVARLINLSGRAEGPSGAKPRQFAWKIYLYIYIYVYIFRWRCPQCCLATVKNKVWMTSDKGKVARQQQVGRQTGVSSLLEQNLHTWRKFCVQCQIKFQLQCSSIFTGWKYLSRIFSLSSRNLFCERLHWRNYTFCGRRKIIFRGKQIHRTRQRCTPVVHFVGSEIDFNRKLASGTTKRPCSSKELLCSETF